MYKKFKLAVISDSERDLLTSIEQENKDDNKLWKVPNLIVPLATILLALICFVSFSEERYRFISYLNIIINGSLPLIAINQISATGIHIFKYDKAQERKFGNNTFMLRTKLFWYSLGVLVLGVILFAVQVINNPFNSWMELVFLSFLSALLIITSSYITRRLYLLQEEFVGKTFDKDMKDGTKQNKTHLQRKYGQ